MRTGPLGQSELLVYTKYAQWAYSPLFTYFIGKKREYFLDLLTKLLLRSNSLVNPGSITQVFWGQVGPCEGPFWLLLLSEPL